MKKNYKYDFSVIIPVYNVESYLEEAILSIVEQDIGFEEHIQIILVNDGSTDKSGEICEKYQQLYPNNITYIVQENSGVSEARNNGMQYIQGKFVNFLDSDDKWSLDAFSQVKLFFEKNYKKINVVCCRMKFFEALDGFHTLSKKFSVKKPEKVVDIIKDFEKIHLHVTSSFFKADALKDKKFDNRIKYGEDALFLNLCILEKSKYGIMSNALHYYRKRFDGSSAIQKQATSLSWYFETLDIFYGDMVKKSIERYGEIILYIQYLIYYDLHWRLLIPIWEELPNKRKLDYVELLRSILKKYISDFIIMYHKYDPIETKLFSLKLKHGDLRSYLIFARQCIYFNNYCLINLAEYVYSMTLTRLEIIKDKLIIEAIVRCSVLELLGESELFIRVLGGKRNSVKQEILPVNCYNTIYGKSPRYIWISTICELSKEKENIIQPVVKFQNRYVWRLAYRVGKFFPIVLSVANSFCHFGNWFVGANEKGLVVTYCKNEFLEFMDRERKLEKELKELGKTEYIKIRRKALMLKMKCRLTGKKIWLISDREQTAGDNGEAFFKYLKKNAPKNVIPYFVIDESSKEYNRMKKFGKVIPLYSQKNLIYTLAAHRIIGSNALEFTFNPFSGNRKYVCDLMKAKFVFLQHGITLNDVSSWLSKTNKNIHLFITSAKRERASIIKGHYGYTGNQVALTGFARYDVLMDMKEKIQKRKKILIAPTWRKPIEKLPFAEQADQYKEYDTAKYRLGFKETTFYKFFNLLIHNDRLLNALRQYDYEAEFVLHPTMNGQWRDFEENDQVHIHKGPLEYAKAFAESSILLTDYSSVFFDFAYLRRPVVYTQFDIDQFYKDQVYDQGYFDFNEDGFGPVCTDLDTTVDALIAIMKRDGELEDKYRSRIDGFYAYEDDRNCERILKAIIKH